MGVISSLTKLSLALLWIAMIFGSDIYSSLRLNHHLLIPHFPLQSPNQALICICQTFYGEIPGIISYISILMLLNVCVLLILI